MPALPVLHRLQGANATGALHFWLSLHMLPICVAGATAFHLHCSSVSELLLLASACDVTAGRTHSKLWPAIRAMRAFHKPFASCGLLPLTGTPVAVLPSPALKPCCGLPLVPYLAHRVSQTLCRWPLAASEALRLASPQYRFPLYIPASAHLPA